MKININSELTRTSLQHNLQGTTVLHLLKELAINPETVLVAKNNEILTADDCLQDNDSLIFLSVVSGG